MGSIWVSFLDTLDLRYTSLRMHELAELGNLRGSQKLLHRIQCAVKQGPSSGRFIVYTPHELLDRTSDSALHNKLRWTSCCMRLAKRYKLKEDPSNNVNQTKTYIRLPGTCLVLLVKIAFHAIVCMGAERQRKSKTSTDACINPNCPNKPKHTRCELIKHSNVATWVSKSHSLM